VRITRAARKHPGFPEGMPASARTARGLDARPAPRVARMSRWRRGLGDLSAVRRSAGSPRPRSTVRSCAWPARR